MYSLSRPSVFAGSQTQQTLLLQMSVVHPGEDGVAAAPRELGPTGPAFFLILGKSKQEEAFMGTCCILPSWMVLLALNTLSSQQPSQSMLGRQCMQSGAAFRLILEPGLVWNSHPCLSS